MTNDIPSPTTTDEAGIAAPSDEFSLSAGAEGPLLLQDQYLIQKMAHFNRERVPEHVVHAKGHGAFGFFEATEDVSQWCKADFLKKGTRTPMLARFSTVAGEQGFPDTVRDPRGFALKFYTQEGNYDLVGNNTPVFFIRDPSKFSDFIHSQKRRADNAYRPQWPVGFLDAVTGERSSSHHPHVGPGHAPHAAPHERLRLPHFHVGQCRWRAVLGQVPLQDRNRHREFHRRRSRTDRW